MSDDRDELRRLVSGIVDDTPLAERSSDRLWDTLRGLGLTLVGVDESRGGSGGDLRELVTVVRTLGLHACGLPVAEAALSAWVLSGDRDVSDRVRIAFHIDGGYGADLSELRIPAVAWLRGADGVVLFDGRGAATYLDLASSDVEVEHGTNLAGEPRDTLKIRGTVGRPVKGAPAMAETRARHALLRAAAIAGAAEGAYRLTREYVMQREQFGKPLARIPAVAASLASMKVALVQLDAAVERAADVLGEGAEPDRRGIAAAAAAAVIASETAATCARTAHQLHGAMGVTREYPLHHHTKRLWAWPGEVGAEAHSAEYLGKLALEQGESVVWDELTR
ncbi:acyl-CoA dehydrogenase family protein [Yinghuangia sp. YIM S09857]|uniref:acyl-CoA dehydrogenase family protein n=1 Tax=Yinghuangia sp. YIM S09857 TaxID=3436929 RepID=UPI003F52F677